RNPLLPDEIVDFAALDVRRAELTAAESGKSGARPRPGHAGRNILRIDANVKRGRRAGHTLPGGRAGPELVGEPRLLLGAEDRLRGLIFAEVRDGVAAIPNRLRRSCV